MTTRAPSEVRRRPSPTRQTERVLVYAIVRAAEAVVDGVAVAAGGLADTVTARRAWWRRRQTRARRTTAA